MICENGTCYELKNLKFSNGLELRNCKCDGAYWTEEKLTAGSFAGGLRHVVITDVATGERNEYANLWLEYCDENVDGGTRFLVRELGYYERQELQLKSNVEYLAMMMGVEL